MSTIVCPLCMLFSVILSIVIIPGKVIDNQCGTVSLRTEKVVENGTVKIEYRPSGYVMSNIDRIERNWAGFVDGGKRKILNLNAGSYEEKMGQHNKYVLTIYRFNVSMNGRYRVYCGSPVGRYTDFVTVNLPEPPSGPVIVGLQDIENCRDCIVGEDNETIALACVIHGGTRPLNVTMTIGNETYSTQNKSNSTTFMVFFTVRDHHHMKNVIFSVMNDALSSPLKATAQMFVINKVDEDDKYNNKQKTTGQASDKSIIWIILGACVLVVVIIVIAVLFLVFRKKGQTLQDKREGRVHHHTQEGHARCTIQKSDDRQSGNQNEHALDDEAKENRPEGNLNQSGNRLHDDNEVPIYSQPIKKKTTENPDNIYSQVNKTRKSASSPSSANSSKVEKDGQLLYADLAFDPNAAPSKAAVAKQEDSPTEYVDIDYVKTKANKEIDDDPTDLENL